MKPERSESKRTAAARSDDGGRRTEKKRSEDSEAFERVMRRGKEGEKSGPCAGEKSRVKPGQDFGDEESWRGRVVEGEAQIDKREQRRGSQRQVRSEADHEDGIARRERRRDDAAAGDVRSARTKQRVDGDARDDGRGRTDGEASDARPLREQPRDGEPGQTARPGADKPGADAGQLSAPAVAGVQPEASGASATSQETRTRRAEVAEIANQIVEAAKTGFDGDGRKLLTMTVDIPGRGRLEIRLRKHGSKMQVELAAESPAFGRLLRRSRKDIKKQTRNNGVQLSSVRVTR